MPRARAALASLACALLLGTAACSSPEGDETPASSERPSASASDAPIFASDEEALAAAVEAYEAYTEMSAEIGANGGTGAERIEKVVGPELASEFVAEFQLFREAGLTTSGASRVFGATLAERSEESGSASVSAYFCRDVTATRVINAQGEDVTPPDRPAVSAVLAHFASRDEDASSLIVEDVETWDAASLCG